MIYKKYYLGNQIYYNMGILFGVIAIISGFYNISLRTETGYMLYFVLAIPWSMQISAKEKTN